MFSARSRTTEYVLVLAHTRVGQWVEFSPVQGDTMQFSGERDEAAKLG